MATFLDILLLALIVATTGKFQRKKQDFRSMRCFRSPVCFFRISSLDSAFLSTLTIFAVQKRSRDKSRLL